MLNKHICIEPYFCSKLYNEKVIATIYLTIVPAILKITDFFSTFVTLYFAVLLQVRLNKLECRGKVHLFQ